MTHFSNTFQFGQILGYFIILLFVPSPIVLYRINPSVQLGLLTTKGQRDVLNNLWPYIQRPYRLHGMENQTSQCTPSFHIDISEYWPAFDSRIALRVGVHN
jgi:hypothetical protein